MLEEKLRAGVFLKKTTHGADQDNLINNIADYIYNYELNIFLGPEWLFLPKNRLYTKKEKEGLIGKLSKKTRGTNTLIIPGSIMWFDNKFFYNTAPIISKGELLGEYHKKLHGGAVQLAMERGCDKKFFINGKSGLFKWRGYNIGVEICADRGLLHKEMVKNKSQFLDLYFLASCGLSLTHGNKKDIPIKDLKYGLCSDGHDPKSEVIQKKDQYLDVLINPIESKGNLISQLLNLKNHLEIYELLLTKD